MAKSVLTSPLLLADDLICKHLAEHRRFYGMCQGQHNRVCALFDMVTCDIRHPPQRFCGDDCIRAWHYNS